MKEYTQYLICGGVLIYFVFLVRFLFLSWKAHTDLVKFEYEHIPEQWERDGEPRGMLFWRAPHPPKSFLKKYFLSNPANTGLLWIFITPKWTKDYPEAKRYLKSMRLNVLLWNIGVLLPLVIFLIISVFAE